MPCDVRYCRTKAMSSRLEFRLVVSKATSLASIAVLSRVVIVPFRRSAAWVAQPRTYRITLPAQQALGRETREKGQYGLRGVKGAPRPVSAGRHFTRDRARGGSAPCAHTA